MHRPKTAVVSNKAYKKNQQSEYGKGCSCESESVWATLAQPFKPFYFPYKEWIKNIEN